MFTNYAPTTGMIMSDKNKAAEAAIKFNELTTQIKHISAFLETVNNTTTNFEKCTNCGIRIMPEPGKPNEAGDTITCTCGSPHTFAERHEAMDLDTIAQIKEMGSLLKVWNKTIEGFDLSTKPDFIIEPTPKAVTTTPKSKF